MVTAQQEGKVIQNLVQVLSTLYIDVIPKTQPNLQGIYVLKPQICEHTNSRPVEISKTQTPWWSTPTKVSMQNGQSDPLVCDV